jgi:hypothetical protein
MITTTLNRIEAHKPSCPKWKRLLKGLGKKGADDEPLPFKTILRISELDGALWCCRVEPQYDQEWRLFAATCARRVQHLSLDPRGETAVDVAERFANGQATDEERIVAHSAAWDAAENAVGAAARYALKAACAAAWDSADAAACSAPLYALHAAASAAAKAVFALDTKSADIWSAWVSALNTEFEWQTQEFLCVVTALKEGEGWIRLSNFCATICTIAKIGGRLIP